MSGLIDRLQGPTATPDERPRVLDIRETDADEVIDSLSSETRRAVLRELFDDPGTPSEIADRVDTSVQNVNYHLTNLTEAGLVEGIDERYSEKGQEMTVYGPANDPIVFVGDAEARPDLERSVRRIVGGVALIGVAALFVQWGAERLARPALRSGTAGPASYNAPTAPPGSLTWYVFDVVEPGLLFFVCCLVVAAVALLLDR
jgi:DNA-binding transcriptional ArsR family regulator